MPEEYQTLRVSTDGPVGWLELNRPKAGNAMDGAMFEELPRAWAQLDADPSVRVIVNVAAGRDFCTGLDVVQLNRDPAALRTQSRRTKRSELQITAWHCGVVKPVIAAIQGRVVGGGLHFVADADIVLAAADTRFIDTHVSVGQVTAFEGIALTRKLAAETVMRLALAGRHEALGADRAYQLGMVSEVVDPPEELRARAGELAAKIARNSPSAMAATKRALYRALEDGLTTACTAAAADLVDLWGHPDQIEGPAAFVERRPARWAPLDREPEHAKVLASRHPNQAATRPGA
ncbi:enoyl-CoA hydratase/isomerase family protein [Frankia sp. AgB1.9]|uniref:enoyl-CoA hydratase/isomerase family protein n=1 Tax=unclassified Frankia TaxID=2632575 RepID=UPI001932B39F|nr:MULTISPECIES: enoyl-CoA hydratase/isomerase family protein [unclassified Frankia]MBL7548858.1 enoyl-CoA hydratase/isomerase family protein [Frankia sp. AgB1.9]MBL7619695.1 enoyl-CoA hydratase/isomerase family protein [Frankia sp. AgB1.8]